MHVEAEAELEFPHTACKVHLLLFHAVNFQLMQATDHSIDE